MSIETQPEKTHIKDKLLSFINKSMKALRYTATALILPIKVNAEKQPQTDPTKKPKTTYSISFPFKKLAIFIGTYFVVQPLSTFLFPTAEQVLRREKLDPRVVSALTPHTVRVIPDNVFGKLYFALNKMPVWSPLQWWDQLRVMNNKNVGGFTLREKMPLLVRLISPDTRVICVKSYSSLAEKDRMMQAISDAYSGNPFKYHAPATATERYQRALLHEIAHTNPENYLLSPLYSEADADYKAFFALAAAKNDRYLPQRMLDDNYILSNESKIHDGALYIYQKANNGRVSSEQELLRANAEAAPALSTLEDLYINGLMGNQQTSDSLQQVFAKQMAPLSPLAKTRVSISANAWKASFPDPTAKKGFN